MLPGRLLSLVPTRTSTLHDSEEDREKMAMTTTRMLVTLIERTSHPDLAILRIRLRLFKGVHRPGTAQRESLNQLSSPIHHHKTCPVPQMPRTGRTGDIRLS